MKKMILSLLVLTVMGTMAFAAPAPDFTLTDTDGNTHTLSDYRGSYVVLEWFNPDCPFVKKHYDSGNMQDLQEEFTDQDVIWFSINSSAEGKQGHYSAEKYNEHMEEQDAVQTAILLDHDGTVGHLYGAKTTPHMFVIDPNGELIYQGAIDDKSSYDPEDIDGAHNYVSAALEESMAGKPVTDSSTPSYGCSVKY